MLLLLVFGIGIHSPWIGKLSAAANASPDDKPSPELTALLDDRLVRALMVATARSSAAVDTAPEMLLLLSVVVRFRSPRLRQTSERVLCARLTY